jgi:hypothetical protein
MIDRTLLLHFRVSTFTIGPMDHLPRRLGLIDTGLHAGTEQVRVSTRCSFAEHTLVEIHARRELGVIMGESERLQKIEQFLTGTLA